MDLTKLNLIQLKPDAQPFAIMTPRRFALPMKSEVKEELARMEKLGVIRRVEKPTNWCAGMVTIPKSNGKIRIGVDLTKLNENVCRETYALPKIDTLLGEIGESTVFTIINANSGFWQEKLAENSQLLTTFLTPFSRYCFQRLPFGLKSTPERFQKRMLDELEGLEGVICVMDYILMHGKTQKEHDKRREVVLTRLIRARITLNQEKCEFSIKVQRPQSQRSRSRPRSRQDCSCRKDGETAKCCRTTKIPGNDRPPTEVHRKPVREDYASSRSSFASRSMTSIEQRYAQVEKEALATTWACEKFADFVLGKEFLIEMDHKPLVPLLGSKCLQDMPPRIQRFRMRHPKKTAPQLIPYQERRFTEVSRKTRSNLMKI